MVFPLLLIILVIFFIVGIVIFIAILPFIKLAIIIGALIWIWKLLPEKVKKIKNWELVVLGIALMASIITIGAKFNFFAVNQLPLAIQEPISQVTLSPLNLFLSFIIFILVIMYIKKK